LFTIRAEEDSRKWEAYLTFIDNLVIDGLLQAVAASLGFFLDETDPVLTQGVLLEVRKFNTVHEKPFSPILME